MSRIEKIRLSHLKVPLNLGFADAKVATGKQSALTHVDLLVVELESEDGFDGLGFSYTLRAGGTAFFALAQELSPMLFEGDPRDIESIWDRMAWRTNSLGVGGLAYQVIAAFDTALWDQKAKRAGIPLAKLWGACRDGVPVYNSGGQYLQATITEMQSAARDSIARGIGGIKMKVGQPDWKVDIERIEAMLDITAGQVPLMIDANQQWTRDEAIRFCRSVDHLGLYFIEEPISARDYEGHGLLCAQFDTPIATGEMLTSIDEVSMLLKAKGADVLQADAPRIGGFTPFLKVMALAEADGLILAPHFVMEQHLHAAAAYGLNAWVEHFDWFDSVFVEDVDIRDGRIWVPDSPGLCLTLSDEAHAMIQSRVEIDNVRSPMYRN